MAEDSNSALGTPATTHASTRGSGSPGRSIESTLITHLLAGRSGRAPDHAAEARALHSIVHALSSSPRAALDALVEAALLTEPPESATAGVSLLEEGDEPVAQVFRWTALAGRLSSFVGGTTPRDFSPCGVCLAQMQPVLFDRPDLCFTYFLETGVPFIEGLVVPFSVDGRAAGTIWVVSHEPSRRFDAEDVRMMSSLADFTGAIYSVLEARQIAEQARDEREWLLRAISHEWRTPLGAIRSIASLLAEEIAGPVSAKQRDLLARIGGAADHLISIVDQVLVGREVGMGDGARATSVAGVDLARVTEDTVAMVEPAAREAGLTMIGRAGSPDARAVGDATTIRQILLNLLGNAIKFTREGTIEVAVESHERVLAVQVRDTGIGIAPGDAERIFERFWRVNAGADGAGMGLAISRESARELGGDLTVDSTPGRGSTFTLTLPRHPDA